MKSFRLSSQYFSAIWFSVFWNYFRQISQDTNYYRKQDHQLSHSFHYYVILFKSGVCRFLPAPQAFSFQISQSISFCTAPPVLCLNNLSSGFTENNPSSSLWSSHIDQRRYVGHLASFAALIVFGMLCCDIYGCYDLVFSCYGIVLGYYDIEFGFKALVVSSF